MADDTTPAPIAYDPDQIAAMLQRLGVQPPTTPAVPTEGGPGTHGVAGFLSDVGTVLGGGPTGLLGLSPDEQAAAGRHALLSFGINMLAASGKSYAPKDFGTVLAAGLGGAQQAQQESENRAYVGRGAQQALAQQQWQNRLSAIKEALPLLRMQQLASLPNPLAGGGKPGTSIAAAASVPAYGGGDAPKMPPEYEPYFQEASQATGIPVELLKAQAAQESGFRMVPGKSGEVGIMQVLPSTAHGMGLDPATLNDPRANILAGARYLAGRGKALGVDLNTPQGQAAALRAYNGGGDPKYVEHVFQYMPKGGPQTATAAPGKAPAAPTAPPGVQVGGDAPPPPGGTTAAAAPSAGGGIGAALNPVIKGRPVPAGKLLTSDAGAIQAGMEAARTGPQPPTALTAGPGAPTQTATATPKAPEAGWGTKIPSAYSDSPTVTAPAAAPAATATAPATTTAPAAPPPPFPGYVSYADWQAKHPITIDPALYNVPGPTAEAVADAQREKAAATQALAITPGDTKAIERYTVASQNLATLQQNAAAKSVELRGRAQEAAAGQDRQVYDAEMARLKDISENEKNRQNQLAIEKIKGDQAIAQSDNATRNAVRQEVAKPILARADSAQAMLRNAQNLELFARQKGDANALWDTPLGQQADSWVSTLAPNSQWAKEAQARKSWDTLVNGAFGDVHVAGMGAQSDKETEMLRSQWGSNSQTPLDRMTQLAIIRKNAEARIKDGIDVNMLMEDPKSNISDIHKMRQGRQVFDRPPVQPNTPENVAAIGEYNGAHPMGEPYVTWAPKPGGGYVMKWARNTGDPQNPMQLMPKVEIRP